MLVVLAAAAAFGSAALFVRSALSARPRKSHVFEGDTNAVRHKAGSALRNGVFVFRPISRFLLRIAPVSALCGTYVEVLAERAITTDREALASAALAVFVVGAAGLSLVFQSPACGGACALAGAVAIVVRAKTLESRRYDALRASIPDALRSLDACFQAGLSVLQAFDQVGREADGALGRMFCQVARRLEMGRGTNHALEVLRDPDGVSELSFVAVALDVQHQAGGSMKPVLDAARDVVEGEIELKRTLRVQTAQAKLSAEIVSILPFVLVALFSVVSPGFLDPFFGSFSGMALLAIACGMQATGIFLVTRMLRVEVG